MTKIQGRETSRCDCPFMNSLRSRRGLLLLFVTHLVALTDLQTLIYRDSILVNGAGSTQLKRLRVWLGLSMERLSRPHSNRGCGPGGASAQPGKTNPQFLSALPLHVLRLCTSFAGMG